ncbi:hypothetical protein J2810_000138 [Chryseobacterium rhizosphaerae]|uniref:hypothetical protein n=1 Tax=Chryseobacterium rhizosphaerae TaxID=395937 RepID=UPI00285B6E3C|nr:hypothetical protein [Chryseobacterium rhizosphaerae]MDR6544116.1 hypothetical protein [Chryseobacterium rhizosphaerae]
MMNVADRYRFREDGNEIRIMPQYSFIRFLVWWLVAGIMALPVIYFYRTQMSLNTFQIAVGLWGVYMIYFLFDLIFRIPVTYIFDKSQKCIYRKLYFSRKIMNFDEMTYFIHEEWGTYYFSIGKKRNQFVKNYRISNYFSGSKASNRREDEYIEKVLCPVLQAVGIPVNQPK